MQKISMYTVHYVLIGWLSFASAKKGLGETCLKDKSFQCASQHCVSECESDGSVSRCVEPKSFYEHLEIAYPECVERHTSEMLRQKVLTATSGIGQKCTHASDCVTGNCVPVCDYINSYHRCIEPVFSFSRYNKPIPTCISRRVIADHLKLFRKTGELVGLQETPTSRPTRTPIGRPTRTQHYLQETGTSRPTRTPIGRPTRTRHYLQETGTSRPTRTPIGRPMRSRPVTKDYLQDLQINWSTNERSN